MRRDIVRYLTCAHFSSTQNKFLTLTFNKEIKDIQETNELSKNLIKRLRYHYHLQNLKYLAVIEFQNLNHDRTIHYQNLINQKTLYIYKLY